MKECPHKILEVQCNASGDEIKLAYKRMAIKYHPDRNREKDAEEKMKLINKAYAILSGKEKQIQTPPPQNPSGVVYTYNGSSSNSSYTYTWTVYRNT